MKQRFIRFFKKCDSFREFAVRKYSSDIAFTPAIKGVQEKKGSRLAYERMEQRGSWRTQVDAQLESFLAELDMFYLGTSNSEGQPYIQYRGGPKGFLKVIDRKTLAFADFGGNRQYISTGNLSENSKAFIFLMDYARARRIKLWGNAHVIEGDAELESKLADSNYDGNVERVILFNLEAWDVNCSQHIHTRYTHEQFAPVVDELNRKIRMLESRLSRIDAKK